MDDEFEDQLQSLDKEIKKNSKENKIREKFCPKCASTNLKYFGVNNQNNLWVSTGTVIPNWKCEDCNYYGKILIGTKEEIEETRKDLNQK